MSEVNREHGSRDPVRADGPDDLQRVDVERVEPETGPVYGTGAGAAGSGGFSSHSFPGGIHVQFSSQSSAAAGLMRPPVVSAWLCLIVAWLFLGSKVPFTVFIGIPLDVVALVLAMVCLSRGGIFTGLSVLALGTVGSFIVYLVGLFRFLAVGL